ncbi:MAG: hypothetical protein ONB44_17095 [candidate division KSB1 bacterium]|nr:hypothetical protein [candidate division KSB1 bacterium]MDZ7303852.1 hypothetical protein [candidate division KSB1 bacterium]MDZ7312753.1 hypothetical protein [candidate division KSB1 bacterium]
MPTLHSQKAVYQVDIPTLYSNLQDFRILASLCRQILATKATEIVVRFDQCTFFKANAVACISAALAYARQQGKVVTVDISSMAPPVYRACCNYKFVQHFGGPSGFGSQNTIELRQFRLANEDLVDYLFTQVPGHQFFPHLSPALRRALCKRFIEIYVNAFTHSRSPVGAYSCGQGYPFGIFPFQLTVVDLGVGIPAKVREFLGQPQMSGRQALHWALQEGHSTKFLPGVSGAYGLGLKLLSDLATLNRGRLEIYSHDSYACIQQSGVLVDNFAEDFPGTVLNLELRQDDNFYYLTTEGVVSPKDSF